MKLNKYILFQGILSPSFINTYFRMKKLKLSKPYVKGITLDIGCGNRFNEKFFDNLYNKYVGLDYHEVFNKIDIYGRGNTKIKREKIDISADAENLPFKNNSIDTILLTEVLEHIPHPQKAIKEMYRVLKNSNYLILTVPFMLGEHQLPFDFFRFTKEALRKILIENNFDITLLEPYTNNGPTIFLMINSFVFFDILLKVKKQSRLLFFFLYVLTLPIYIINNFIALIIDKISLDTSNTLGYFIIARKNE